MCVQENLLAYSLNLKLDQAPIFWGNLFGIGCAMNPKNCSLNHIGDSVKQTNKS